MRVGAWARGSRGWSQAQQRSRQPTYQRSKNSRQSQAVTCLATRSRRSRTGVGGRSECPEELLSCRSLALAILRDGGGLTSSQARPGHLPNERRMRSGLRNVRIFVYAHVQTPLMFASDCGSRVGLAWSLKMSRDVGDNCTSRDVLQLRFLHLIVEKSDA